LRPTWLKKGGEIGTEGFRFIMQDEHFDDIQLILETPNTERWPEEIKMLEEMTVWAIKDAAGALYKLFV